MTDTNVYTIFALPGEFEHWLRSKKPEEPVGIALSDTLCPLATYGQDTLHQYTFYVTGIFYGIEASEEEGRKVGMPVWAQDFVAGVDDLGNSRDTKAITAQEALAILKRVLEEGEE